MGFRMKTKRHRKSISQGTLRIRSVPFGARTLAAFVVTVLAAELLVGFLVKKGVILSPSLEDYVEKNARFIQKERPRIWVLGNSTLENSVDPEAFNQAIGTKAFISPHGGATIDGSIAMFEYYLEKTQLTPETVVFLLSQDDFNPNGARAIRSKTYQNRTWQKPFLARVSQIHNISESAPIQIRNALQKLKHGKLIEDSFAPSRKETEHLETLTKDYALSLKAFSHIPRLKKQYRIPRIYVAFVPVTNWFRTWHEEHVPGYSFIRIQNAVRAVARANQAEFLEGEITWDRDELFQDSYHMNSKGRALFTPLFAAKLKHRPGITERSLTSTP